MRDNGIANNYLLVRTIERQSDGLPGRALTLSDLALQQESRRNINTAEALFDDIVSFFDRVDDPNMKYVLACFALGGDIGMSREAVRAFLEIRRPEFADSISNLSGTGTIMDATDNRDFISVRPSALRPALIREVIFGSSAGFDMQAVSMLLENAPSRSHTARELIKAKELGAEIPRHLLETYIAELPNDHSIWSDYTFSQEADVKNAIMNTMSDALGEDFELKQNWEDNLKSLLRWIKAEYKSVEQALARRTLCSYCAREWILDGNDSTVGYKALLFAMTPTVEAFEHENNKSSKWIHGCLTEQAFASSQTLLGRNTRLSESGRTARLEFLLGRHSRLGISHGLPGRQNTQILDRLRTEDGY